MPKFTVTPANLGDEFDLGNEEPNLITLLRGEWIGKKPDGTLYLTPVFGQIKSNAGGQVVGAATLLNMPDQSASGSPNISLGANAIRLNADGFAAVAWTVGFSGGASTSRTTGFHELLLNSNPTATNCHTYHRIRTNNNLGSAAHPHQFFKVAAGDTFQIRSRRLAGAANLTALPGQCSLFVIFFEA